MEACSLKHADLYKLSCILTSWWSTRIATHWTSTTSEISFRSSKQYSFMLKAFPPIIIYALNPFFPIHYLCPSSRWPWAPCQSSRPWRSSNGLWLYWQIFSITLQTASLPSTSSVPWIPPSSGSALSGCRLLNATKRWAPHSGFSPSQTNTGNKRYLISICTLCFSQAVVLSVKLQLQNELNMEQVRRNISTSHTWVKVKYGCYFSKRKIWY